MRRIRMLLALLLPVLVLALPVAAQEEPAAEAPTRAELAAEVDGQLVAEFEPVTGFNPPGRDVELRGRVTRARADGERLEGDPVPADFSLRVVDTGAAPVEVPGRITTAPDGTFTATLPGSATAAIRPDASTGFQRTVAIEAVDVEAEGQRQEAAGSASLQVAEEAGLQVEHSFVTSRGWVKPGEEYVSRVLVRNFDAEAARDVTVTLPGATGATLIEATPVSGAGAAAIADGAVSWEVGEVPGATDGGPGLATLVVGWQAASLSELDTVVWRDLSATATVEPGGATSTSHGPKVIPPDTNFDTHKYGDRPFPVVPVDFRDFKHLEESGGEVLADAINNPEVPGSTFNLFQEMSYGQLFPNGTVPSAGIETADFTYEGAEGEGFEFTQNLDQPNSTTTCTGATAADQAGGPVLPERISDGWYQLPGDVNYYGQDSFGSALVGPLTATPYPGSIDAGCGDTGKSVFDAAAIADPEIDYDDFDTDKDGVVDFFMMVFVGCGGNGVSQLGPAAGCTNAPAGRESYDNIWPHSSSLEAGFFDPETGLAGYVSDDQLTDFDGTPLYYTDDTRSQRTREVTDFPVYVRVGPYNVNPETSIERASVISHEYGHSLGLPDYYSNAGLDLYSEWNLMASDFSQFMDVNARQELGWVVPEQLAPNSQLTVEDVVDGKINTGTISWETPSGEPYTLVDGQDGPVNNGQAFGVRLPGRQVIDPALVEEGASGSHVWWSGSGDGFGCVPAGHNLDIDLSALADVEPGTEVTMSYQSYWDIEWDFDYGFNLVTVDGGATYTSLESQNDYTTPVTNNPQNNSCQARFGNGITGTSGSYEAGTEMVDRIQNTYPDGPFLTDNYDLSEFAGQEDVALRFHYSTDAGVAEPGWFIDDLKIMAGDRVIFESDFEEGAREAGVFNGGCDGKGLQTAPGCSTGWTYLAVDEANPADHAYYFELRDRSTFDLDGRGESDRGLPAWEPGVSLTYTDENVAIGNVSRGDFPAQTIVDAVPVPGETSPNLDDAAFTTERSTYSDAGDGHVDNYGGQTAEDEGFTLAFDCLSFDVLEMAGNEVPVTDGETIVSGSDERDLTADLDIATGSGCEEWNYGFDGVVVDPEVPGGGDPEVPGGGDPEVPGGGGGGGAAPVESLTRVAGAGRIETAIEASRRGFPDGADVALLARADQFPDALSAAPLAAELGAPVLLTPTDELAPGVSEELSRLGADRVYLLGGDEALQPSVEAALGNRDVTRLEGADRFETSAEVAREIAAVGGAVDRVVLARGDDFADALTAGNLSITGSTPILLTGSDQLAPAAEAALQEVHEGQLVLLAGGTAALSDDVAQDVRDAGFEPKRLAGADRYATGARIAQEAFSQGADPEPVVLASGVAFPDALTASPLAAQLDGVLLLVDPSDLGSSGPTAALLESRAAEISTVIVAGGVEAVSQRVADQAAAATAG